MLKVQVWQDAEIVNKDLKLRHAYTFRGKISRFDCQHTWWLSNAKGCNGQETLTFKPSPDHLLLAHLEHQLQTQPLLSHIYLTIQWLSFIIILIIPSPYLIILDITPLMKILDHILTTFPCIIVILTLHSNNVPYILRFLHGFIHSSLYHIIIYIVFYSLEVHNPKNLLHLTKQWTDLKSLCNLQVSCLSSASLGIWISITILVDCREVVCDPRVTISSNTSPLSFPRFLSLNINFWK